MDNNLDVDIEVLGNCDGDATASAFAPSGMEPFTYSWSTGANTMSIDGLVSGVYYVTVEDDTGCTGVDSVELVLDPSPEILITGTNPDCFGESWGTVTAEVTNIPSGNSFSWSTGDDTPTVNGLPAGTYFLTVTNDDSGCFAVDSITLTQPDSISSIITGTEPNCFGESTGTVSIEVFGGVAPYYIEWQPSDTGQVLNNVPAGEYIATVFDANGCIYVAETFILGEPEALEVEFDIVAPGCEAGTDGSITALISGGTAPFDILWNTGDTTSTINGLMAGTYSVIVTDANGCVAEQSIDLPDGISPEVVLNVTAPNCFGETTGSIAAIPSRWTIAI